MNEQLYGSVTMRDILEDARNEYEGLQKFVWYRDVYMTAKAELTEMGVDVNEL